MLQSKELDIKNTLSPCGCCKPPENDDLSAIDFFFFPVYAFFFVIFSFA